MMLVGGFALLTNLAQTRANELPNDPRTRALPPFCAACPTGPTGAVGSTGITGPTGSCTCVLDGYMSWNTQSTIYNAKDFLFVGPTDPSVTYIFSSYANTKAVASGWVVPPSTTPPNLTVTAEFEVPANMDTSVPPVVNLHWFNSASGAGGCSGTTINWEVTASFLGNGDMVANGTSSQYQQQTGDITVLYATGPFLPLRQQQTSITLSATGPAFVTGAYAQISATRVAPSVTGNESDCPSYLTLLGFKYRKAAS